jgi:hypothetical protein
MSEAVSLSPVAETGILEMVVDAPIDPSIGGVTSTE